MGKSSLINALRGVRKGDPGYAATEAGKVGTLASAKYPFPDEPHLVLWDVPGGGEKFHPSESYWTDQCLDLFDCLVIVVHNRVTEVATFVAEHAVANNRRFVFVHTKSEFAVTNTMGDDGVSREAAVRVVRANVRKEMRDKMGATGAAARLLLVDSHLLRAGTTAFGESELCEFLVGCTAERSPVAVTPEEIIARFRAARGAAAGGAAAGGGGGGGGGGGAAGGARGGGGGGGGGAL